METVRNQGNLTSSYRPNSGGIKENLLKPMAELVDDFLEGNGQRLWLFKLNNLLKSH